MSNEELSKKCRNLLLAEDRLKALKTCVDNMPVDPKYSLGLIVRWEWGSSCPGYDEMRKAVTDLIKPSIRDLMLSALQQAATEVSDARKAVLAHGKFTDA